ncbi:MAG: hypothetical protein R6X20_03810 [Phycisphaerae bacterium]
MLPAVIATTAPSFGSARMVAISRAKAPFGPPARGTRTERNVRPPPHSLKIATLHGARSMTGSTVLPNWKAWVLGFPCHPRMSISAFFSRTALTMPRAGFRQYRSVVLMGNCGARYSICSTMPSCPGSLYHSRASASVRGTWSGTGTMCRSSTRACLARQIFWVFRTSSTALFGLATATMMRYSSPGGASASSRTWISSSVVAACDRPYTR